MRHPLLSDMRFRLLAVVALLAGCHSAAPPSDERGGDTPPVAAATSSRGDVPLTIDEKNVKPLELPPGGERVAILDASSSLPAFASWRTLHVLAEGGRSTVIRTPATAYPGSQPTLRRGANGKIWFELVTASGPPGPSATDVTEIMVVTQTVDEVAVSPVVLSTDDDRHEIAWKDLEQLPRVDAKRRQKGLTLASILRHANVAFTDATPMAVVGRSGRVSFTGADLVDDSQFVLVATNKRGAINVAHWNPIDAKNPAGSVRNVERIIVGEKAKTSQAAVAISVDGTSRDSLTWSELKALPAAETGSRRTGYTLLSAMSLRDVSPKRIAKVQVGDRVVHGDELRDKPSGFVLRRNRKGRLQLRVLHTDERIKDVDELVVTLL